MALKIQPKIGEGGNCQQYDQSSSKITTLATQQASEVVMQLCSNYCEVGIIKQIVEKIKSGLTGIPHLLQITFPN